MKKHIILAVMLMSGIMYSQTKKNGTAFIEHPAINIVEAMQQAWVAGDADKVSTYLADNFKSWDGTNTRSDYKGTNKEQFLKNVSNINKWVSYLSISRQDKAYPDAIEYKESGLWVQTWDYIRGIHNETGVKIDQPVHRLFKFNKDNKIETMIDYSTSKVGDEIRSSFATRTNGTIYNHHDYINKVRNMMGALEHGDTDKAFSYFAEDAKFTNLDMAKDESHTVAEEKAAFNKMLEGWTIDGIDVVGYPDYLEYEIGNGKVVQSWWNARMTRKSDGKKVELPIMLTHDFNDEGMITREIGYYTTRVMEGK